MKRTLLLLIHIVYLNLIYSQSVEIKDSSDETLLIINDEGTGNSSITIPISDTPPDPTTYKLYNEWGNLKWNGATLATGSPVGWTDDGAVVRLSDINDKVGIGTTSPLSKLSVGGNGFENTIIYGETSISNGIAIYGESTNTGSGTNYGGYFEAAGSSGRGVYGEATNTGTDVNYGGYFVSGGIQEGHGVYGQANGTSGIGVFGFAQNSANVVNHGGFFEASGGLGRGIQCRGLGWAGYFEGRGYFSGNVGIGTTSPSEKLDVNGNIVGTGLTINGTVAGSGFTGWDKNASDDLTTGTSFSGDVTGTYDATVVGNNSHNHTDVTVANDITINNGCLYALSGSGNVGIGNTSPSEKLDVTGNIRTSGEINAATAVIGSGTSILKIEKITGTLASSGGYTDIPFPSGWTQANTFILHCDIWNSNRASWISISSYALDYDIYSTEIRLSYNDSVHLHNQPYRLVLMKL